MTEATVAQLYHSAGQSLDHESAKRREEAVSGLVAHVRAEGADPIATALASLLLYPKAVKTPGYQDVLKIVQDADRSFVPAQRDAELQLIACAALGAMLKPESEDDFRVFVATALRLVDSQRSMRALPQKFADGALATLVKNARELLTDEASKVRARIEIELPDEEEMRVSDANLSAVGSTLQIFCSALLNLDRNAQRDREETEVLWWAASGVSRRHHLRYSEQSPLAGALLAADDLARTAIFPPDLSMELLLRNTISRFPNLPTQRQNVLESLFQLPTDFPELAFSGVNKYATLCPISFALRNRTQTHSEARKVFKESTGMASSVSAEIHTLATQYFWERTLAKKLV
jgi:hypothetical protein